MAKTSTPKAPSQRTVERQVRQRTQQLRAALEDMALVCSGTLISRTKVCGRKNCRCATDPEARHGPYHEWSRRIDGRLRHSVVSPEQAELLQVGIENYRRILRLLRRWEEETTAAILGRQNHKP